MTLTARNLTIGYDRKAILTGLDVELRPGGFTVLIGANGSGKSTLLRTLTNAQPPLRGTVEIDGKNISGLPASDIALRMSLVLTDRTGGGGLTLKELVAIGRHPHTDTFGRLSPHDREVIAKAIEDVRLSDKADSFISALSDGERQKAMIARAIAQETEIIVLDEPTSFLDVSARFEIMNLLGNLGKTILLSTHDIAPAMPLATDIWTISGGRLHTGSKQQIIDSGILDSVYPDTIFDLQSQDFRPGKTNRLQA